MCTTCGHTRNWNTATRRCGCGCTTRYRRGEPGVQGAPGTAGANGNDFTAGVYVPYVGASQSLATNLVDTDNLIDEVSADNDSVKLLPATKNTSQQVRNYGDFILNIYPQSGEEIDELTVNVPYLLYPGSIVNFVCFANGSYTT